MTNVSISVGVGAEAGGPEKAIGLITGDYRKDADRSALGGRSPA